MTPKLLPTALILGCTALLAFAFIIPSNTPQSAATAYAQSTPSVSFTQEEVQAKEGSTIYLKVRLNAPVTKTTKVTIKLTPDAGTTSRDIPGLTGTKTVTFYKNGTQTKTVAIRTSRTAAEGDKSLTASITKVGNTTVQGDTARILVKDQRSSAPLAGNQNTNTTATTTPPVNCAQYEGVIPGESRKLRVVMSRFANFSIPGVDQAGLDRISQDLAGPMRINPANMVARLNLGSGEVYAYRFTTSEYNVGNFWKMFNTAEHVGSTSAPTYISVSQCAGDLSSPVLATNNCIASRTTGPGGVNGLDFGITSSSFACNLEPNKTYYLNITSGFQNQSVDAVMYTGGTELGFFGYKTSTGGGSQPPIMAIKGLEETYRAIHSIYSEWNRNAYNSAQQLRSRIASCLASGQPRSSCNFELGASAFPGQWR